MKRWLGSVVVGIMVLAGWACPVSASSVLVNYSYTGVPGSYLFDFSVTNNIPAEYNQMIYFFGVDLPYTADQGSPAGWAYWGGTWDNESYGGSSHLYPSTWMSENAGLIYSGETLSGFSVHSANIPAGIRYYAYAYPYGGSGVEYYGDDAFYKGYNPGFEGFAEEGVPGSNVVPEPATVMLLGAGLTGFALRRRRSA